VKKKVTVLVKKATVMEHLGGHPSLGRSNVYYEKVAKVHIFSIIGKRKDEKDFPSFLSELWLKLAKWDQLHSHVPVANLAGSLVCDLGHRHGDFYFIGNHFHPAVLMHESDARIYRIFDIKFTLRMVINFFPEG
jgi:hypothetical protein